MSLLQSIIYVYIWSAGHKSVLTDVTCIRAFHSSAVLLALTPSYHHVATGLLALGSSFFNGISVID